MIIVLLTFVPLFSEAQEYPCAFIRYFNECVNVFQNPLGREVRCQVFQDSINETNYYKVELLEKSPLRFKVRMQAYDFSPTITGWLDKECIAVYPRFLNNRNIVLYEEPGINPISISLKDELNQIFTVLDYQDNKWLKVMFMMKNEIYIGWIDEYCPIIYNSCS